MVKLVPFQQFQDTVFAASAANENVRLSLSDLVQSYQGGNRFKSALGDFHASKDAFKQFVVDRLDFPLAAITRFESKPTFQQDLIDEVLRSSKADLANQMVNLRLTGGEITNIVSGDHVLLENSMVVMAIAQMMGRGTLPDDLMVHRHHLAGNGRVMYARFVSKSWEHQLNGGSDPAYAGFYADNNELGSGAFKCGATLARVACWNTTQAEDKITVAHRFATLQDFMNALGDAIDHVSIFAAQMAEQQRSLRDERLEHPIEVFEKVGQHLGVPVYAMIAARKYFLEETGRTSLFDVVQGITAGTRLLAEGQGKRQPNWTLLPKIEREIIPVARHIAAHGEDKWATTVGTILMQLADASPDSPFEGITGVAKDTIGDREVYRALNTN